jgi:hypothetical protein
MRVHAVLSRGRARARKLCFGERHLRADGSIYYSPTPGFTGRDTMRVQRAACNFFGTWHADPFHDWCGHLVRTVSIFVE